VLIRQQFYLNFVSNTFDGSEVILCGIGAFRTPADIVGVSETVNIQDVDTGCGSIGMLALHGYLAEKLRLTCLEENVLARTSQQMEGIRSQEACDHKDGVGRHHRNDHLGKNGVVDVFEGLYHADDSSGDHVYRKHGEDDHC
jgi:hypothetical protein